MLKRRLYIDDEKLDRFGEGTGRVEVDAEEERRRYAEIMAAQKAAQSDEREPAQPKGGPS